jgi:D-alanyl-D-alanine carboxypeptidase
MAYLFSCRVLLAFFGLIGLLAPPVLGQITTSPPNALISNQLSSFLQQRTASSGVVGGILAVYSPGQWYWNGGAGSAFQTGTILPAQPAFGFRAGSITKTFVSATLLKLQEQQLIDLDDPITLHLPANITSGITNASQISVRKLLNHTSGIKDFTSSPTYLATLMINGLGHVFAPSDLVAYAVSQGPAFTPGNGFFYSNTNFVLAALVIQSVTGQPYEQVISTFFLQPLGLTNTYFPTQNSLFSPAMGNYADLDGNQSPENYSTFHPSSTFGSGAIATTLSNAIRWRQALEEGLVLTAASLAEMKTFLPTSTPGLSYGLGLQQWNIGGVILEGHTGNVFNSSDLEYAPQFGVYFAFNVTNLEYPQDSLRIPLYQIVAPYLDSCQNLNPVLNRPPVVYLNAGDQDVLQTAAQPGYQYQWFRNGQALPGSNQPSYPISAAGTYQVEVTDGWSCSQLSPSVQYKPCVTGTAALTTPGGETAFCTGEAVTVFTQSGLAVDWKDGNGTVLGTASSSFQFIINQPVTLIVNATDSLGCRQTDTLAIAVQPQPVVDLGPDLVVTAGDTLTLTAGAPGDTVNWYNSLAGGLVLANSAEYQIVAGNIPATIWAVVINKAGCTASDTVVVDAVTRIGQRNFGGITLLPNPARDQAVLRLHQALAEAGEWTITDSRGREIEKHPLAAGTGGDIQVNISGLPAGLYAIRVRAGNLAWQALMVVSP